MKVRTTILAMLTAAVLFLSGCAGFEGRLHSPARGVVGIQDLIDNHRNFRVFFAGRAVHMPTALVFDPKDDDLTLTFHESWATVKTPTLMEEVVKWLLLDPYHGPSLYEIHGTDGRFYGYIYTNQTQLAITAPEPGVLRLGNMHPTHWDFIWDDDR